MEVNKKKQSGQDKKQKLLMLEWPKICERLKSSGYDLSKIKIVIEDQR